MFFASPERLYWLFALLPMIGAAAGYLYWQRRVRETIGEPELVEAMSENRSRPLQWVRLGLAILAAALLVAASAEPKWGRTAENIEREGVDLVYALDLSKSMLAGDVPPTRLEAATAEMKRTLDRLDGDRAGLVVYTTVSFVQSPLTTDYGALRFYLEKLDPSQMSVGGTAIGKALRDSVELLTGEAFDDSDSRASRNAPEDRADTQVAVLMSDGEDHETDPLEVARTARKKGIQVVTVGIGSEAGANIPVRGHDGEVKGYKRNDQGDPVETSLEEEQLRKIAEAGGGEYIRYDGNGSVANELSSYIDKLEASQLESEVARQYRDRYLWFAIPAFVFLLAAFLLGERRQGRLGWSSRSSMLVLVAPFFVGVAGCEGAFRAEHGAVREGNRHFESSEYTKALGAYDRAASELDDPPGALYFNRGRAHLGKKEFERAREAFGRALGSEDPSVRFDAHTGIGTSFVEREKWKRAAEAFRRGLSVFGAHPDAVREQSVAETRHNLELVYRKLYPPCSNQEDELEENDSPDSATQLDEAKKKGLTLCGTDDDWYAIPATRGATVTIEATFRRLGEHDDPHHVFLPNSEDLRMNLFGANGETKLRSADGDPDAESPRESPVERTIDSFEVGDETPVDRGSRLLLQLTAADKLKFDYDLSITVDPPCGKLQEDSESNDTRSEAAELEAGQHEMQMCAGDTDWFRVDVDRGNSLFVDVRPTRSKGANGGGGDRTGGDDLDVEVVDLDTGEAVGDARRDGPFWTAGLQGTRRDRSLGVRVTGRAEDIETGYRLDVYNYPPCMAGDDRYEENDSLRDASPLDQKTRRHRYLRLCPRDDDFYTVKAKKKEKRPGGGGKPSGSSKEPLQFGLRTVPKSPDATPDLQFSALDPKSGTLEAHGSAPGDDDGASGEDDRADKTSSEARFDQTLEVQPPGDQSPMALQVSGETTFYHLSELPSGKGGSNDPKNDSEQNKQEKRNRQDSSKNKRQKRSRNSEKQQNSKQENPNQQNKKKSAPKNGQKQSDNKKSRQNKRKPSDQKKRARDILQSLENSDENFQMQKALEKNRQEGAVEKDW